MTYGESKLAEANAHNSIYVYLTKLTFNYRDKNTGKTDRTPNFRSAKTHILFMAVEPKIIYNKSMSTAW